MKVILDTNFIIYCAKNKLDYVEGIGDLLNEHCELVVPSQVINELKKLRDDKWKKVSGKDKTAIDLALQLLKVNNVKEVEIEGNSVDEGMINLANENKKNIVCTFDREMRKKLPRVILLNRKKKLILTR